jgi:hypothetical protein
VIDRLVGHVGACGGVCPDVLQLALRAKSGALASQRRDVIGHEGFLDTRDVAHRGSSLFSVSFSSIACSMVI